MSANSTQTIDILVSLSAQENTQHQFTLTSVEANAAIIGVPITLGIFNTVASTTIPTVNNIIGISVTNNREAIGTTLIAQKPDSLYKEYDEYLYTPSATPGQPSFRQFINKPESLIYTYYNNYTMTTQFLSETSPDAVKSIRSLAENSPRILKTSRFFTKDNKLIVDGFLDDAQFARDARSVEWYLTVKNPNAGLYNFYHLYIAKDNSEAFIVSSSQTGIKKNGIVYISMDTPVQSQYVPKNLGR